MALQTFSGGFWDTNLGKSVKIGTAENFGFGYKGWGANAKPTGFLGLRAFPEHIAAHREAMRTRPLQAARIAGRKAYAEGLSNKAFKDVTRRAGRKEAMKVTAKTAGKMLGSVAGAGFSLALTGYFAYDAYKRDGALAAMKETSEMTLINIGLRYAGRVAGQTLKIGKAAGPIGMSIAATAVGTYMFGEAAIARRRSLNQLEIGSDEQLKRAINTTGAATMRQRSLMALNNTHLNARSSLGNEAMIMYRGLGY